MKLTRRQLAALISSTATAAALSEAQAQTPAESQIQAQAQPQTTPRAAGPTDEIEAARARLKANGELLAQHELPMATEPAFQFKA